ncbi:hypothetical protein DS6A_87 [Mycobacterium phage DS6A]|uniref:Uncharacterized protein n=1 Tax=Mycobacterium phage DS6A TaxID=45764 RepID=G8I4J7_9CAUD|nr:hypothetical protein DS6A_87 [Mycobacterium phage DS6A]AER47641.1 hypothetical protein DS6A_87 [Mycobacterium phage DS6A]
MSITVRRNLKQRCPLCETPIRAGDEINTDKRGRPIHTSCDAATYNPPADTRDRRSTTKRDSDKQQTYTVKGQRSRERHCTDCHLIHAGECF